MTSTSLRAKAAVSVAAVGATIGIIGLGTFGTFTSTTAAQTPSFSSGTVVLDFGPNGTTNELATGVTGMAAGDAAQRMFTLRNSGSLDMASVAANVSATTSSLLDSSTGGLTLLLQQCSTGWVKVGPGNYTCSGTTTTVLAATPVATLKVGPTGVFGTLTAGTSASLLATWTL